jgi:hypothetical protein
MRTKLLLVLALAGCGTQEPLFSQDYTKGWCDHYMACEDPAVLVFDGITEFADCEELVGPQVITMGIGCKYKGAKAKACLLALEQKTCQSDDAFEFDPPAACLDVYPDCDINFSLVDEPEPSDEDDTDGGDDTDTTSW